MQTAALTIESLRTSIATVIRGKDEVIELVLVALLGRGHVLVEDVPEWGRPRSPTPWRDPSTAPFIASNLLATCCRPMLWASPFTTNPNRASSSSQAPFSPTWLLADEINRTTPKHNPQLLEAMNESKYGR